MNKKELLQMRKLTATPKMMELVRQDPEQKKTVRYAYGGSKTYHTYHRYQYYRAIVENGILKLAVFSRKHLAAGCPDPEYEIYLSKEGNDHLTYETASGKWRTGKIDNLTYDLDDGRYWGNIPWASEETKKRVNDYLGTGTLEVKEAVLRFQLEVAKDRIRKKRKSELEEIDAVMSAVPPLPKDFDKWVLDSAFIHERYLLYRYGEKEAYCTHCQKTVKLKITPRHNKNGVCPSCRSNAMMKAWKKQKYLIDEKRVGILQKLTDGSGYILRRFFCRLKRTQENDWKLEEAGCWEENRTKLDTRFARVDLFEWGEFRNTGIIRWCHGLNHGGYGYYYGRAECVLYPRNLKRLRKGTELQYIPIEEMWKHNQGCYCDVIEALWKLRGNPQLEYLLKAGLYRLSWDIAAGQSRRGLIDWSQKKVWRALRLTKEQLFDCIRMDITARQLDVLQRANDAGVKITAGQIRFFTKEIGPDLVGEIFQHGHLERFRKYLEGLEGGKGKMGDYMDHLEDIRKLHIIPDTDILFPKDFQQTHQRLSLQRQEQEDRVKKMEIAEKDRILQAMLPEIKELYSMEDKDFLMAFPACKEDFNREGRENHNCVGGSYYDKMLEGKCCVMFLRRKEEPGKAFCTVEMQGSRIVQCRAVRNSAPPKEAEEFMERFSRKVEQRIRKKQARIRLAI